MSSPASHAPLGDAILQSVEHGSFPQDEQVASAAVPASALPDILDTICRAREEARNQVRTLSRESASDVDGWIAQARKLQDDIKRSQETAKEIVQHAEGGKERQAHVQDSASKVSLLHSEITYNETLAQVVEQLRDISTLLDSAQNAAVHGHVMHALNTLEDAKSAFNRLGPFQPTRVANVLKNKESQLRKDISETVTESWNGLIQVDNSANTIFLRQSIEREAPVEIGNVVDALSDLDLLDSSVTRLSRDLDRIIVAPRLALGIDKVVTGFHIQGDGIQRAGQVNDGSIKATLQDLHELVDFLSTRLPPNVAIPLSSKLIPIITSRLISSFLLPAVPLSTHDTLDFQETLSYVLGLVEYLDELEWTGQNRLTEWVDKSAEIWLAKQKEAAIAKVQGLLPKKVQEKIVVERVETQVISRGDALHGGSDQDDDWTADWDDDATTSTQPKERNTAQELEEEDMSAWGEEEDADDKSTAEQNSTAPPDNEDADDWGADWDEDEDAKQPQQSGRKPQPTKQGKTNLSLVPQKSASEREMTLSETYTVTSIPDTILEIIIQVVADVQMLNSPKLEKTAIAPASGGLYAIPGLLLALYRATAVTHYTNDVAGNMLIYNDCQRISDRLRAFLQEHEKDDEFSSLPKHLQVSARLKPRLDDDIKAIDAFGKRAYGREMEAQRQIIRDHLEDAQGFQGCTNVPFASVCDDSIATTIDRIAIVKRQWQNILSHSALLQSLGSLVSAALTKFVSDIEDMSDIAEDESKKLHSYCVSLASLSQHFQTRDDSGEVRDMVSMYTPNWFKFQYLSEILDSSLADIKYFWTDGELKLEMDSEEVIGLIEALFAPSEYRRKAISDIRRTGIQ
ncbi:ribosome biogenesis protein ytm1 [Coniothyrium glycines]